MEVLNAGSSLRPISSALRRRCPLYQDSWGCEAFKASAAKWAPRSPLWRGLNEEIIVICVEYDEAVNGDVKKGGM